MSNQATVLTKAESVERAMDGYPIEMIVSVTHEQPAAQGVGQWMEKQEVTSDGEPVHFTVNIDRTDRTWAE